jgi:hypothetical protein
MATSKMKITVEAEVAKANAELQKINQSIDKMKTSQEKVNGVFDNFMKGGKIAIIATTVVKSIQKVVDVSKEMIDLYKQQALAEAKLEGSLIASGNAIGYNVGELKQMASQFQSVTTFGDEVVMSAQGMMLAYQNVGKNVFPEAIKASMDLSTALGKDLNSATQQLGKALNNPIEGMSSLKEIGISLTKDKQALITKLTNENKLYEAQRILLDEVNSRYGGMAEKIGALDVSKLDKIKNLTGDIGESFGQILSSKFSPAFDWMEKRLQEIAEKAQRQAADIAGETDKLSYSQRAELIADKSQSVNKIQNRIGNMGQLTPDYIKGSAEIKKLQGEIANLLLEQSTEAGKELQTYWVYRLEQEKKNAINERINNPKNSNDEKFASRQTTQKQVASTSTSTIAPEEASAVRDMGILYQEIFDLIKSTNVIKIQNLEADNEELNSKLKQLELMKSQKGMYEKYQENIDTGIAGLQEQLDVNNASILSLQGENTELLKAQEYIKSNTGLLNNVYEIKIANLQAEIATAEAMLTTIGLSKEEIEQLQSIITLKQKSLDDEISGNSEITKFLEINKQFIQDNVVSREEELQKTRATAVAQLALTNLTEEQKKNLEAIIKGIDLEVAGLKEVKSWADKMEDALNTVKPDGWDDWFDNLEGAVSKVEDIFSGMFSSISGYLSSSFDVFENETKIKLQSLEKELDKMVKENDKARKKIDDNESDSMKALQEQYDADAISYADYQTRKGEIEAEAKLARDAMAEAEQQKKDEMLALENELNRKKFEADKRNNIATAIMNGATAAIKAFADLGPIFGGVMAATIAGITAAQVANISSQQFIPALKEGGVALSPTLAQVGDGDEPELVLPLSKAKDFGFGTKQQPTQVINVVVENNTIYGIDDFGKKAYDAIKSAQRIGKVPKQPF